MNCTIVFHGEAIDHFSHCINLRDAQAYAKARYSGTVYLVHDQMTEDERSAVYVQSMEDPADEVDVPFTVAHHIELMPALAQNYYRDNLDAEVLACEGDSGVGADTIALIDKAEALLAVMADIQNDDHDAVRLLVCQQASVFYFG